MFSALIMCQTLCQVMGGTELNKSRFLFRQMREKEKEIWLQQNEVSARWTQHCGKEHNGEEGMLILEKP